MTGEAGEGEAVSAIWTLRPPTHPGELLREDIMPAMLAERLGVNEDDLRAVLACEAPITSELAAKLAETIGGGSIWIRLQRAHDAFNASVAAERAP